MLIDLAIKLLKHHQSLEELDLGDCQSGGRIGSSFLKEKIIEATMDIRALTRAEDDILSELEKSLGTSSKYCEQLAEFPRLQRLDQDRPWRWFEETRAVLRVLGSRPGLTSEDETEKEEYLWEHAITLVQFDALLPCNKCSL